MFQLDMRPVFENSRLLCAMIASKNVELTLRIQDDIDYISKMYYSVNCDIRDKLRQLHTAISVNNTIYYSIFLNIDSVKRKKTYVHHTVMHGCAQTCKSAHSGTNIWWKSGESVRAGFLGACLK